MAEIYYLATFAMKFFDFLDKILEWFEKWFKASVQVELPSTPPELPQELPIPAIFIPEVREVPIPPEPPKIQPISPSEHFYNICKANLGVKLVSDENKELGCARAISTLRKKAFGNNEPFSDGTWALQEELKSNGNYSELNAPEKGAIIISATGTGNGTLPHGHVGVCGIHGIMSNDSATGQWEQNYSYIGWESHFGKVGGFPIRFFLRIKN